MSLNNILRESKLGKFSKLEEEHAGGGGMEVGPVPNNSCLQSQLNIYTASVAMLHLLTPGIRIWGLLNENFSFSDKAVHIS